MARINGEQIDLHRLQVDVFVLKDGTEVSPQWMELTTDEMGELTKSGQAEMLMHKWEPVFNPNTKAVTFKLRTNKSRMHYRREQREKTRLLRSESVK